MSTPIVETAVLADGPEQRPESRRRTAILGWRWFAGRVLFGALTLLLVATLVFFATQALPSDAAAAILGKNAPPEALEALRAHLGLDQPLMTQYAHAMGRFFTGDLGTSIATSQPVSSVIGEALRNSLLLVALVALIVIPGATILGFRAAVRRDGLVDKSLMSASMVFTALPEFFVGLTLVIVFSTGFLHVLPAVSVADQNPLTQPDGLVLPVATLVLASFPYIFRLARSSMTEVLASDYVIMARLKGVPERQVIWRHAARNALVAPLQGSAVTLAYLLGGVVVVETVFSYPGLGTSLVNAINVKDLPVIQAVVMIFAGGIVVFNILADALTVLLTPRLRTATKR